MYVLDTNVISELRPGKREPSEAVRAWAQELSLSQLFLSAVTILELEIGVMRLERRTPPEGGSQRAWIDQLRRGFAGRILPFTERSAVICAAMHVPNPRSERDAMIGAAALEHGFVLVTRNTPDFAKLGVQLLNPWEHLLPHEKPSRKRKQS